MLEKKDQSVNIKLITVERYIFLDVGGGGLNGNYYLFLEENANFRTVNVITV